MILFHRFLNSLKHIALRDLPDLKVFFLCAAKGGSDLSHQKKIHKDRFTWSRHDIVSPFFEQPETHCASRFARFKVLFSMRRKRWIRFVAPKENSQRQIYLVAP